MVAAGQAADRHHVLSASRNGYAETALIYAAASGRMSTPERVTGRSALDRTLRSQPHFRADLTALPT